MSKKKDTKAEEYVNRAISTNINDPDGYYKLAIIFLKEKDYLSAYEQISFSINKELNNTEGFYISGFDNISRLKLADLYILRSEIAYEIFGKNKKSCDDLNIALEKSKNDLEKFKIIQERISQICD